MAETIGSPRVERKQDARIGEPSFEAFVTRERPRLVAIAERILLDREAADDVAQDVLASFARRYSSDVPLRAAWLRAATVHRAYDVLRGERRRRAREIRDYRLDEALREAAASATDPAVTLERDERHGELRAALRRIGKKHASILALRYGGLSYAEIAAVFQVGIGSVGTMLARAEASLGKELKQ